MTLNPTPMAIANQITVENGRFNGHNSFIDAFLSVLPESSKAEANDDYIESLYVEVQRNVFSKNNATVRLSVHPYETGTENWALLN